MLEDIKLSFKGIWSHRLRSFLTMLGIIVGVAAVIAVVSTISGTNEQIKNNLIGDGTNTVTVQLYQDGYPADFSYSDNPDNIAQIDESVRAEIIKIDNVVNVTFIHQRQFADQIYYLNQAAGGATVYGIDRNYFETAGFQIVKGRGFSEKEINGQAKVALIDTTVRDSIFSGVDPIGKTLEIMGEPFVVIGIADKKSEFEPKITTIDEYYTYAQNSGGNIFITDNMWPLIYRYDEPRIAIVKSTSTDTMTQVGKDAANYINSALGIDGNSNIKYQSINMAEAASELAQLSSSTNILLIGIASISLLVGGIGVMNIMLVSVTERTREIGIKKALGAKKGRIRRQFLMEAVILSGIGGILGVIVGIALAKIISLVAMIPTAINIPSIIIAVVFSMVIGIVFGMVPSIKASNLNPIDALRYE